MLLAVDLTMPSVGIRSVAAVYSFRSRSESFGTVPALERSTARSRVAIRLTSCTTGASSPSDHSTCSICAPYFGSRPSPAVSALLVHSLPSGCVQSCSATAGNGTHACAFPGLLTISTRVVTSNLRHASGLGINGALATAPLGNTLISANPAPLCRNSRLRISNLPFVQPGTFPIRSARTFITSGRAQSTSPSATSRGLRFRSRTTVDGSVWIFHALATARSRSSRTANGKESPAKKRRTEPSASATLIGTIANGSLSSRDCNCLRLAISARQGSHQVAKKWTRTTRPRCRASSCTVPSRLGSENSDLPASSTTANFVSNAGAASRAMACTTYAHSPAQRGRTFTHLRRRPGGNGVSNTIVGTPTSFACLKYYCGLT